MSTPYVHSAVNGMKIPLHPNQRGILHRFAQPENRLVISRTSETSAGPVSEARLVLDSEDEAASTVAPQADASAELRAEVAAMQAMMKELAEQNEALKKQAAEGQVAPAKKKKVVEPAFVAEAFAAPVNEASVFGG